MHFGILLSVDVIKWSLGLTGDKYRNNVQLKWGRLKENTFKNLQVS